jgi:aminopeptidase
MVDPRLTNLAKTLVRYSTKVQPKDHVAIIGSPLAEPLICEILSEVLSAGGYPYPFLGLEIRRGSSRLEETFFSEASLDQLEHVSRTDSMIYEEFEVMITIYSKENTHGLSNLDPHRFAAWSKARTQITETRRRRTAEGNHHWCVTLFPTSAHAQDAEMGLHEFEDFVFSATYSDLPDPVAEWNQIHDQQQKLVDWMAGKDAVKIKGPNVELSLSIKDRTFINSDGTFNMPSGEIYTGPVEDSVNGWVDFTFPAVLSGREVEGIHLEFENGRVVEASAKKNEQFLLTMLDVDPGARYLGEWAIGTNNRIQTFTKNILFDEKIGGTMHMALGAGYPQTGSTNKSAIHWDMICNMRDGGEILVDGEKIYESGKFLIG